MLTFKGLLKTSAGGEPRAIHGMMQYSPSTPARRYSGWFQVDGVKLRGAMASDEFQLDIEDGPCLRIRVGEVDHGTAEFESVGDPLRDPPKA